MKPKTGIEKSFLTPNPSPLTPKIILALLLSLTFTSCVTLGEEMFFFPENRGPFPSEAGVETEELSLASGNDTISGIRIKNPSNDYLIYFYGNWLSVYESKENLVNFSRKYGLNVVCFDYHGYGKSTGKPGFDAQMQDAAVIYDYIVKTYRPKRIYMFSQSIGTVPCTFLGSSRIFDGIIMEAGFTSAKDAVPRLNEGAPFPPIKHWVKLTTDEALLNRTPQPVDYIRSFRAPLLYLHGDRDEVFPQDMGKKLFDAAGSKQKTFVSLKDTGHSHIQLFEGKTGEELDRFFKTHKK